VEQLQLAVLVTVEQRLIELVVKSKTALKIALETALKTTAVDQLTKAFKKVSVNLLKQVQS
jgi:hypothetical protein